jgi:hypothetical protein
MHVLTAGDPSPISLALRAVTRLGSLQLTAILLCVGSPTPIMSPNSTNARTQLTHTLHQGT